jgi:ppGpp synthetase/RelA/SpoT-type nucleotidyltranferase
MPLAMTRGEFNRLGERLIASEEPAEADLVDLAGALVSYQDALEHAKDDLRGLGFASSGRVKTTKTMLDKLRRTHGMELSRVQDLAGARIVVHDLAAQDSAMEQIRDFYVAQGSSCRVVDRRTDPRFGYKAVHLVIRIDDLFVEVQVRTELQDTWAQIIERLADRWGRGIRYGEEPENPETTVRSGAFVATRREAIQLLMALSDAISTVENQRRSVDNNDRQLKEVGKLLEAATSQGVPELLASEIPPEMVPMQEGLASILAANPEELDAEGRRLADAGSGITGAELTTMAEICHGILRVKVNDRSEKLRSNEQRLRDILQLVAGATDEGE